MRVISQPILKEFWGRYPQAEEPLGRWYKAMLKGSWKHFGELKTEFPKVDQVGKFTVFNIGGNKYRLIVVIHYNMQKAFIRNVLTHAEYDQERWKAD